jgi:hypothetical protein
MRRPREKRLKDDRFTGEVEAERLFTSNSIGASDAAYQVREVTAGGEGVGVVGAQHP